MFKRAIKFWRREVLRDPFLQTIKKWFRDDGDNTLRLDYPLNPSSVIFDVGGYRGDFAETMRQLYGSRIFVFEPHPFFYSQCTKRFLNDQSVSVLNYGLSNQNGWFDIIDSDDGSSFVNATLKSSEVHKAELVDVREVMLKLNLQKIDLLKINIEGGEYTLLPALLDSGLIKSIEYIQVQFHDFIPNAVAMREKIRSELMVTHEQMWNYPFVWESWKLRGIDIGSLSK